MSPPKGPEGAAATEDAVRKYLKELEAFVQSEISKIDEQITASRKLRGGPQYNPAEEIPKLNLQESDYQVCQLPKVTIPAVSTPQSSTPTTSSSKDTSRDEDMVSRQKKAEEEQRLQQQQQQEAAEREKRDQEAAAARNKKKAEEEAAKRKAEEEAAAKKKEELSPEKQEEKRKADAKELIYQNMLAAKSKGGMLTNWGKKKLFGRSFSDTFVKVDEQGIAWYKSEREMAQGKPIDSIPFYILTNNSRGSKFKTPAVCWPLITTQECNKATDKNKVYFGVQYTEPKDNSLEFLVFAAKDTEERNQWVFFITKYIKLYLAAGPEFMEFEHMRVGAEHPLHQHGVLDGEAPRN